MSKKKLQLLSNTRYLVCDKTAYGYCVDEKDLIEIEVLEISPKGMVKIKHLSGCIIWEKPSKYEVIEELKGR